VKNRMPEIGASGTVRGGGGNILTYSETPAHRERCNRGLPGEEISFQARRVLAERGRAAGDDQGLAKRIASSPHWAGPKTAPQPSFFSVPMRLMISVA